MVVDQEGLTTGCVPRCVDQFDGDIANHHRVAAIVDHEIIVGDTGDLAHELGLGCLHVHRDLLLS